MARTLEQLEQLVVSLQQEISTLKNQYRVHQHDDVDGTYHLRKNIILDSDQSVVVGCEQLITQKGTNPTQGINYFGAVVTGEDMRNAYVLETPNMELISRHLPDDPTQFSFFSAQRNPLVAQAAATTIDTTAGGNTTTIDGYDFETNELAGAYINVYSTATGALAETHTIASNTSTQITITGTWLNNWTDANWNIYTPVFLGQTIMIWRRLYLEEGSATGGLRIGGGATANGQNGLLYMDATGDLYWRDKANSATKLNNQVSGISGSYFVADSSGGAADHEITFTNGLLTAD